MTPDTQNYIKSLVMPNGRKPAGRKAWSIDLESTWIPFFTATNTVGDTQLPPDSLGAPLRLAYAPDGTVRFSKGGRPILKVDKPLADTIRMVRDNFTAGLQTYTQQVITGNTAGYKKQVATARRAGEPIIRRARDNLDKAMALAVEKAIAEAEAEAKAPAEAPAEVPVKPTAKVPVHA